MSRNHKTRVVYEVRGLDGWHRIKDAAPEPNSGWLRYNIGDGRYALAAPKDWRIVTASKENPDGK